MDIAVVIATSVIIACALAYGFWRSKDDEKKAAAARRIVAELPKKIEAADAVRLPGGSSDGIRLSNAKITYECTTQLLMLSPEWEKDSIYLASYDQLQAASTILENILSPRAAA
jgi:hypothetical protein